VQRTVFKLALLKMKRYGSQVPGRSDPTGCFDAVSQMASYRDGILEARDLRDGFVPTGERLPLINPQRGIFKPRQMGWLLSIRTVFPRSGARVWYDDQREAHRQIYVGDETTEYAFMGLIPRVLTIGG
jgi:putative restriction endonuclease